MAIQIEGKKYQRQLEGYNKWKNSATIGLSHTNCWGTWNWCTGVGKTFGACIIINRMLEKNDAATAVVVVPGPDLKKQWKGEIRKHIPERFIQNITIYTVGEVMEMIKNDLRLSCTLFIADELHEYYTQERLRMFDGMTISCRGCLGLTATYEDIHGRHKLIEPILPIIDRIDEEEATREGYVSQYLEYNLGVDLTPQEKEKYDLLSKGVSKNLSMFGHGGLNLAGKVLQGDSVVSGLEYAIRIASQHGWRAGMSMLNPNEASILEIWSPQKVIGYAKLAMESVRERKNLLYSNCTNKLKAAVQVVNKFSDLKTICFSQSTTFADALGKIINNHYQSINQPLPCVVFHSQLETKVEINEETGKEVKKGKIKQKREAIEAFASGKKRIMSTASALDKGLDIPDIRLSLTTSGTQNPTQYRQRKGRAIRYEQDIMVLVVNLYAKATMDEIWLKKRQSTSNNVVYWIDSIDDINYSPQTNQVNNDLEV